MPEDNNLPTKNDLLESETPLVDYIKALSAKIGGFKIWNQAMHCKALAKLCIILEPGDGSDTAEESAKCLMRCLQTSGFGANASQFRQAMQMPKDAKGADKNPFAGLLPPTEKADLDIDF